MMHDALSTNSERYRSTTTTSGYLSLALMLMLLCSSSPVFLFFSCAGLRLDAQALAANASSASGCGDLAMMMGAPRRGATTGLTVIWESANQTQHNPLFFRTGWGGSHFGENRAKWLKFRVLGGRKTGKFFFTCLPLGSLVVWFNSSGADFRNRSGPFGSLISIDHPSRLQVWVVTQTYPYNSFSRNRTDILLSRVSARCWLVGHSTTFTRACVLLGQRTGQRTWSFKTIKDNTTFIHRRWVNCVYNRLRWVGFECNPPHDRMVQSFSVRKSPTHSIYFLRVQVTDRWDP